MKYSIFISFIFIFGILPVLTAQPEHNLVLSEVMFNPAEPNSEFVEIYNPLNSEPVNAKGLQIKYQTSSADFLIPAYSDSMIQPGQFAVIFEGDYDFENGTYKSLLPDSALILKLDDNAFGSSGMANSSDRTIYLLNSAGDTLTFYTYSANNPAGISDEKINLDGNNDPANWANSLTQNGTPGSKNSVSPVDIDAAVVMLKYAPQFPVHGDDLTFTATISNLGSKEITSATVNFYDDENSDSLFQPEEIFESVSVNVLAPGDSVTVQAVLGNIQPGEYLIHAEVTSDGDGNLFNNGQSVSIKVNLPAADFHDLVINEIMYKPENGEPEWVEIFNASEKDINIEKWSINDKSTGATIKNESYYLNSGDYLILAENETITDYYKINSPLIILNLPSLNNSGDAITIKDSLGRIIDSVEYRGNWGGENGKSLERIDPAGNSVDSANWSSSVNPNGATPGFINSVTKKDFDAAITGILFSPLNPIRNDTVSISASVKNTGKEAVSFYLKLYEDTDLDSIAEKEIETSPQLTLNANDSVTYDFTYKIYGIKQTRGYAVKLFSAEDQNPYNNSAYSVVQPGIPPKSLVINEIMFVPENGEPEWVEIYNRTENEIDLYNWSISDVLTNPVTKTIDEHLIVPANGYFVITKSSAIYDYHRIIPSPVAVVKFANLNNDKDGVVIKDNRSVTIDSVFYDLNFSGKKGFSIERIDFSSASGDFGNWQPSLDLEQSTPGRINSVSPKKYDLALAGIDINPEFPVDGDDVKIKIKIINRGNNPADNFSVSIFTGKDAPTDFLEQTTFTNLSPYDSVMFITSSSVKIKDTLRISAGIEFPEDEDIVNNRAVKFFVTGYKLHSILISEVMFNPAENEPEWIEFYNNGGTSVNLKRWTVSDKYEKNSNMLITYEDKLIEPGEYFVLTKDTSTAIFEGIGNVFQFNFGKLNNHKDSIKIFDFRGATIDSMKYGFTFTVPPGKSLERISYNVFEDSANWSFSLSPTGNTLGKDNSLLNATAYSANKIVINEIMFEPDDGKSEYVELFNNSRKDIELGGWNLTEGSGKKFPLSFGSKIIHPKEFYLIAADSSIHSIFPELQNSPNVLITNSGSLNLSNSEDKIIISDIFGNTIDSVNYSSAWHNPNVTDTKNKSLERINPSVNSNDPANWSTSASSNGGTPLKKNSIFTGNISSTSKLEIAPNPFSPDNDGFEDFTVFAYNLTKAVSQIRIRIFDSQGRKVRTLIENQPSGAKGEVIFDGLDDSGKPLRIGIYIVLLEALDESSASIDVIKKALVIARKL